MTFLHSVAIWAAAVLIAVMSALAWIVLVGVLLLWPIKTIVTTAALAVVSMLAVHLVRRRPHAAVASMLVPAGLEVDTRPAAVVGVDDPLRLILGPEVYAELAALSAPGGPATD